MFLEKQIQNVESIVSRFEDQLAKDSTIFDQPKVLQNRYQQLQVQPEKHLIVNMMNMGCPKGIQMCLS